MEVFRTVVPCPEIPRPLSHSDSILMLGSCFAENIGSFLKDNLFNVNINPTGTLYNPLSLSSAVQRIIEGEEYKEEDLFFHNGLWRSFDHHSRFSMPDKYSTLSNINRHLSSAHEQSKACDVLVITLGTAYVYRKRDTGRTVSNCHKLPGSNFKREPASVPDIKHALSSAIDKFLQIRPSLRIIATVSPIRHLRDNPHENSVSKSRLICALDELQGDFGSIFYFPSYEILLDELRDYRFYAPDMAHPSETAVQYICDRFTHSCLNRESALFIKDYEAVRKSFSHSLKNTTGEDRGELKEFIGKRLDEIEKKYSSVDLSTARQRLINF
ncbi:MAG: GSCFA domain-containing protein [Fibrobacterota bacterium]